MSGERPKVLAQRRFAEHERELSELNLSQRFSYIYEKNLWGSAESRSGLGSTLDETAVLRKQIVELLGETGAKSLLDIPCGDFHWLSQVDLGVAYTGGDIVEAIVQTNQERYGSATRSFLRLDLTGSELLPRADLVLCRDCLVHLSFENIHRSLHNIRRSGSRHLLMTHFTGIERNHDIADGDWRPLNFELPPFQLGKPEAVIVENCTEEGGAYRDKSLALWRVDALPELQGTGY